MKVLAFSASNSASSINHELVKYTLQYLKGSSDVINLKDFDIPMYCIDFEKESGFPEGIMALYNVIKSYDAYIISIPEHNGNFPAFFKNILDWLSRIKIGFFDDKPILLLNAAPGLNGGKSVLNIAKKTFSFFAGNVVDTFILSQFASVMVNGKIHIEDSNTINEFNQVIEKFEYFLNTKPETV
jgi:chromate reductase